MTDNVASERTKALGILDDLVAAFHAVQVQSSILTWLHRATSQYDPETPIFRDQVSTGRMPLLRPVGDEYLTDDVMAALRTVLEGPKPPTVREPGQHVPLRDQNIGAAVLALANTNAGGAR